MINLRLLLIPFNVIFKSNTFILLGVKEAKQYENGKPTNTVIGFKYEVVDTVLYEKFSVTVAETKATISQEAIDNSTDPIKVSFNEGFARPYKTQSGEYTLSFKAKSLVIVNK